MRHLFILALVVGVAGWATTLASAQVSSTCAANTGVSTGPIRIASDGGTASVSFTVAQGCTGVELSLVAYQAPSATFDQQTASQQVIYKTPATGSFDAGSHTLTVAVPSCYFQIDFVYGTPIQQLGPAGTNNFYGRQGRLIASKSGGTTSCQSGGETGGGGGGDTGGEEAHATICHTTDSGSGYTTVTASVTVVLDEHLGRDAADIIPPFTVNGVTYTQNWDERGQAIYENGCVAASTSTGGETNGGGETQTPPTQTPPATETPTTPVVQETSPAPVPLPSITLVKRERVGSTGDFTTGPVSAKVGDTLDYQLVVTNTGTTDVSVNLADAGCTSLAPTGPQGIKAGMSLTYTCAHVVTAADGGSYTNVAIATANNAGPVMASVQSTVTATVGTPAPITPVTPPTSSGVLGAHKTVKHKAHKKHHAKKVKKVTKKAKRAHAVLGSAGVTG